MRIEKTVAWLTLLVVVLFIITNVALFTGHWRYTALLLLVLLLISLVLRDLVRRPAP